MIETFILLSIIMIIVCSFLYIQEKNKRQNKTFDEKEFEQRLREYRNKNPYNGSTHSWLIYKDKIGFYRETYTSRPDEDMSDCDCDDCGNYRSNSS
jgi:hypothetical protein